MRPSSHPRQRRPLATVLAIAIATAPFATAVAGPAEDKATARELAREGIAAEQKGNCTVAIDRLERAESMFHAPPHLQYLARCYTKVGRLVDATETWRKLTFEALTPNAPPAFRDAVNEANAELPKLEPRLARLTVTTSQKYEGLVVEVDGKAWPSAALDVARVIDPGKHVVRARATGFKTKEAKVEIGEGKSDSVTLTLDAGADPAPPAPTASTAATASPSVTAAPTTTSTADAPRGRSPLVAVGWVTASLGLLAVGAGVYTGISANSKFDDLDKACPTRNNCAGVPDLEQRKDEVRRLETATNYLLIGGGILAVAGISMVLLAPSRKGGTTAMTLQFAPTASGGHVALTGSF